MMAKTQGVTMDYDSNSYGLWGLVVLNSVVFIMFAFSFFKPTTPRDWRTFGTYSAFVVALFAEMYGFPLTIYALSGWLQTKYPDLDLMTHNSGHLWSTLFGLQGDPHYGFMHLVSFALLGGGFYLLSIAWHVLYHAHRANRFADSGIYARIRHPQYVGFVLIMLGFLFQWPTILTLVMFPMLVVMYGRLAKQEETEMLARFGRPYQEYLDKTPRFIPNL